MVKGLLIEQKAEKLKKGLFLCQWLLAFAYAKNCTLDFAFHLANRRRAAKK